MGFLKNLTFNVLDPYGTVINLVGKWHPRNCKNEKDYENSLADFLEKHLDGIPVIKQAGSGRNRADIEVGGKVMIELKYGLDSTAKCQRLKGQIDDYRKTNKRLIIILAGKIDNGLKKDLEKFISGNSEGLPWSDDGIDIIVKR